MHLLRIDTRPLVTILLAIGVLLFFSIPAQAAAISERYGSVHLRHFNKLVARQETCNDSGSHFCNITGAASAFCCPASTECIPLENATSVICCNIDQTCDEIHPITCPTSSNDAQKCGDECCPLGFECDGSGKKCLMKAENIPPEYKERGGRRDNGTSNGGTSQDNQDHSAPILPTASISCPDFPAKAIVVGLFPGLVLGAALMILWTKLLEAKTRRRSIKSFGVFTNAFPSAANLNEKGVSRKPSVPTGLSEQPPIPGGASRSQQPRAEEGSSPSLVFSFRSPNLGPHVPPVRPQDQPPTPTPSAPAESEVSALSSPDLQDTNTQYAVRPLSDPTIEFKPPPAPRTQNFTRLPAAVDPRQRESGMTLFSDISPVQQRRNSIETGYSASVYNDGNEIGAFPFTRTETAVPPIPKPAPLFFRQAGGPMPRPPIEEWRQVGKGGRV